MPYQPAKLPDFKTLEETGNFFANELAKIAESMSEQQEVELRTRFTEPKKPRNGMIVFADGANWDPGSGRLLYYFDGSWQPLATGTPTGYTDEMAQDAAASALTAGAHTGISFGYNDPGNAINATVTITQYTDAMVDAIVDAALLGFWFLFTQAAPATTWTINHNLGRPVSVTVFDSGSNELLVEVHHVSTNQVQVLLASAISGYAYCV